MAIRDLQVEVLSIDSLIADERNPRRHSERQTRQIARSIAAFGFNVPILIDGANRVLAGHGRIGGARELGWTEVPVIRIEHLSQAQARAFAIADNRLTENSSWDDGLLGTIFKELAALDLDFSLEDTGFSIGEIDLRIESVGSQAAQDEDPADAPTVPDNKAVVSRPGDLWLAGDHRILCANALQTKSYEMLLRQDRAAASFTDPPYNVRVDGHVSGLGRFRHREFAMATGEMSRTEFVGFLTTATRHMANHSVEGALHYICMDWRHTGELLAAGDSSFSELKNICVWRKHNAGMGSLYRSQHEFVFVYKSGRGTHRNNVELGKNGRHRSNVWDYPGANIFGRGGGEEGNLAALHPTVKPVRLVADAILDCTAPGDIVLDPFVGSGSTLIAAERTRRHCYGIEIDPLYVDLTIRRWQAYSGGVARHAVTGHLFDDHTPETSHGR